MHFNNLESKASGHSGSRSRYNTNYLTLDPEVMLGTFPNMIEEQNFVDNEAQLDAH